MDKEQFQHDKLDLIHWITQIQDHTLLEKIKHIMSTSNENLQFTKEQESIIAIEKGQEITSQKNSDELLNDARTDYKL